MGLSAPSTGKACGASPLRASLRSVLQSVPGRKLFMGLSAPSTGKACEASPLRASLRSVLQSVPGRN